MSDQTAIHRYLDRIKELESQLTATQEQLAKMRDYINNNIRMTIPEINAWRELEKETGA